MKNRLLLAIVALLALFSTSVPSCGFEGDPILDNLYTRNVYPGTSGGYDVGSQDLPYDEGYFQHLYIDGQEVSANVSGNFSGNVTDHGALTGLLDDDHPQYHNNARGDARYYTQALLNAGQLDTRYYTETELDAGQLDTRYYTETQTDTLITNHANLSTGTHGVGTGTVSSVSTANKNIYVDKEAGGSANGTSWTDAFTTIQAAIDSMEDIIIHAYTVYVRDGTKKTGTADENTLNHLVDDASSQFVAGDVGKRVFNITDGTWGVVGSFIDAGDLGIVDEAGAALDLFPAGNEAYVIEPTPYRETVYLNSLPATNPAHLILGSLTIRAEHYWYAACDAQANAGEILDASADFSNVEVGDRVMVLDVNGAGGAGQDYEYGTVDDISQVASHIVRTTLTKTPTTNWKYVITKTEISGSDDGLEAGTARDAIIENKMLHYVTINGFLLTFSDLYALEFEGSKLNAVNGCIFDACDYGIRVRGGASIDVYYLLFETTTMSIVGADLAKAGVFYVVAEGTSTSLFFYRACWSYVRYSFLHNTSKGYRLENGAHGYIRQTTIHNDVTTGLYARQNSTIKDGGSVINNATTPEDPVGTSDNPYIGG